MSKSLIFYWNHFWATYIDIWLLFTGHTGYEEMAYSQKWTFTSVVWILMIATLKRADRDRSFQSSTNNQLLLFSLFGGQRLAPPHIQFVRLTYFNVFFCFFLFFLKMGQPRPLFCLFSVFSNKHYNFYNKYLWKNVHPVYGAGIRTHDLRNVSLFP